MSNHVWLRPGFTSCDVAREVAAAVIEEGTMSSLLACKYYAQGYCQFGTHCHYAHDDWTAEKRVATSHSASAACMTALRTKNILPKAIAISVRIVDLLTILQLRRIPMP